MSAFSRRAFLDGIWPAGTAAAVSAMLASRQAALADQPSAAAAESITVGLIGTGGRYQTFLNEFARRQDVQVAAVCDVDEARRAAAAELVASMLGHRPREFADFRRLLDEQAIDAVFVATPHHWHCPIAVPALLAGKDVYLEKPASHVFREGRLLLEAARKHGRIVQHGTQMRSSEVTAAAGQLLASGLLGEIKMTNAWNVQRHSHRQPAPDGPAPPGVDYNMYLGPAPLRPFNPNRFHGSWNWYRDYGNGDIGNDGVHDIDMARWALGVTTHPVRITAHGSRIDLQGEREFPDNMLVAYQYAEGKVLIYEDRGWTKNGMYGFDSGNAFYGSEGTMIFSRRGYFQVYMGAANEPGPSMRGGTGISEHVADFLDCVRTRREPAASAEVAHLTCGLVHLGEIAYRVERVLHFDPQNERILHDDEADRLLTKQYRQPWGLPDSIG